MGGWRASVTALLCAITIGVLCLHAASATSDGGNNPENMQKALRILEGLTQSRKGVTALRQVVNDIDQDLQTTHRVNDVVHKRKGLEILQQILDEMESDLINEQKRNCRFNLGGHCATESAAYLADHWHYLNSPLSPGRKRRDTGLYRALVSGRLFKKQQQPAQ